MWIRQNQSWIRVQNQLEQDEIAKAELHNPFRKLPKPLMDEIRWCALEPTPSAKIMKDVSILWCVLTQSGGWPYGPGRRGLIHAVLPFRGAVFFRKMDPDFVRRYNKIFAISDIPLDAEPTTETGTDLYGWQQYP